MCQTSLASCFQFDSRFQAVKQGLGLSAKVWWYIPFRLASDLSKYEWQSYVENRCPFPLCLDPVCLDLVCMTHVCMDHAPFPLPGLLPWLTDVWTLSVRTWCFLTRSVWILSVWTQSVWTLSVASMNAWSMSALSSGFAKAILKQQR